MSALSLYGFVAVTFMLVCYVLEDRSRWWRLAFAAGCLMSSSYGFLQGAWPFGAVELLWAGVAVHRWWRAAPPERARQDAEPVA